MKNRAKEEALGNLHAAIAEELLKVIKSGEATPGHFSAAIKFLKDNHIESVIEDGNSLHDLYKNIPSFVDLDVEDDLVN